METKKWYESKTFWAVIITIIVVIAQQFGVVLPDWVEPMLLSAGLLFDRTATKKIGNE